MNELGKGELSQLKEMFWDYDYPASAEDIYKFVLGEIELDYLNREQVVARMLVYIRWYHLIDIFGLNNLKDMIKDGVFKYISNKEMREDYQYVKTVLDRSL
jgi:hypothetical protein